MSVIKVLEEFQRREFETPPKFTYQDRKQFFNIPFWGEIEIKNMFDSNKIGFVLQLGYFKATNRFYKVDEFHRDDYLFVCKKLKITESNIRDFKTAYEIISIYRHRQFILGGLGISSFNTSQKDILLQEAIRLFKIHASTSKVFYSLTTFLKSQRIEVPSYYKIVSIVTKAVRLRDNALIIQINEHLTAESIVIFDKMLSIDETSSEKTYLLTQLKRGQELMKPKAIRSNISDNKYLREIYSKIKPVLQVLDLSNEMVHYYAQFVIRSQVFQVSRRENRYLMLICFIAYQFKNLNDILIDTLLRTEQQFENVTLREVKETIYQNHVDNQHVFETFLDTSERVITELTKLESITLDFGKTVEEKVKHWVDWVNSELFFRFVNSKKSVENLKKGGHIKKDDAYYKVLEEGSRGLQVRVSEIIKTIDFACENTGLKIALDDFKLKNGNVGNKPIDSFLKKQEKEMLSRSPSATSLYKVLLTQHIVDGIKSGQVSLNESFNYKAYENYLIPDTIWQSQKTELLKKTNSEWLSDWETVKTELKKNLKNAYENTFSRINNGENKYVQKRKDGKPRFTEPNTERKSSNLDLFPKDAEIPIIEVLNTLQEKCNFLNAFQHFSSKNRTVKPSNATFFAGILAYGCNIGLKPMARNSFGISGNNLENTVNWYFSVENVRRANDIVLAIMEKLKIGELFKKDNELTHTSSDGQKYYIQVDSIHANYSFKYFGKEKGIVSYSFIDEGHRLFDSITISPSEREATYILDGLLHNQVVQSDMHSTDTHGTNGTNFILLFLAKIKLIPRIADFQNHNFYVFPGMEIYKLNEYDLKLGKSINDTVIANNWDMICRLMVTILSNHCSATTLMKRLGSYSHQHPVLQALRELDKIKKTEFLLEMMDDVTLRQIIPKQLNKGENANKFARAVFYGNSGEVKHASREEQLLADACKRLVQNLIIAWNYLYLKKLLFKASKEERPALIKAIEESSPVHWQHFNLNGTFDFSTEILSDSLEFNIEELINFDWKI